MELKSVLNKLKSMASEKNRSGMARYGIDTTHALGVSMASMRPLAKEIGKNHRLAAQLWKSGIHEARILAVLVDEPNKVTPTQMERWAKDCYSWDLVDQCCNKLFDKTPYAYKKALEWCEREEEFVKRAGFSLMATMAVHDKKASDEVFMSFLPIIERESVDGRNFVKKAVNWSLRQIGKRNLFLNGHATRLAGKLAKSECKSARWIGRDAYKELMSEIVRERVKKMNR
jgi:3-methyladenine DNA glycosylase AlkD